MINAKAYLYMMKIRLINNLAYRFDFFIRLLSNFLTLLITVFLWKAVYRYNAAPEGVTETQMVTYTIMSVLLSSFFWVRVDRTMADRIREGYIAIDFLRPVNLLAGWFCDDLGGSADSVILSLAPLLVFSCFFIAAPLPPDILTFLLFFTSAVLSYCLIWLVTALTGMIVFWYIDLANFAVVRFHIVRLLSGAFIPMWFFPQAVRDVSAFLPFIYIYQLPLGIFIGKFGVTEALFGLAVQAIWIAVLTLVLALVWSRARLRVVVQGG